MLPIVSAAEKWSSGRDETKRKTAFAISKGGFCAPVVDFGECCPANGVDVIKNDNSFEKKIAFICAKVYHEYGIVRESGLFRDRCELRSQRRERMDINKYKIFLQSVDSGSFSKVAEEQISMLQ